MLTRTFEPLCDLPICRDLDLHRFSTIGRRRSVALPTTSRPGSPQFQAGSSNRGSPTASFLSSVHSFKPPRNRFTLMSLMKSSPREGRGSGVRLNVLCEAFNEIKLQEQELEEAREEASSAAEQRDHFLHFQPNLVPAHMHAIPHRAHDSSTRSAGFARLRPNVLSVFTTDRRWSRSISCCGSTTSAWAERSGCSGGMGGVWPSASVVACPQK